MSTASINISAVQTGTAYTNDLNDALGAIDTCHSGAVAPVDEVVTGKLWLDTGGTDPILKIYRTGWKTLFTIFTDRASMTATSISTGDLTVASTATFSGAVGVAASQNLTLGTAAGLTVKHVGTLSSLIGAGAGGIRHDSAIHDFRNAAGSTSSLTITGNTVALKAANATKLLTTTSGVTITGTAIATDFNTTSDRRLKQDIRVMNSKESLDKVNTMQGVTFRMEGKDRIGLIAQDVEEVIPQVVNTREDGFKGVNYGDLVAVLIEAVKEQQHQIDELRSRLDGV